MLVRRLPFACLALGAACLLGQDGIDRENYDREGYARDYVRFLLLQLDQWSQEFPHQFYLAMMKPPVDASKLAEGAKAAPGELGDSIKRLTALASAKDVMTSAEFRSQLDKTLAAAKDLN